MRISLIPTSIFCAGHLGVLRESATRTFLSVKNSFASHIYISSFMFNFYPYNEDIAGRCSEGKQIIIFLAKICVVHDNIDIINTRQGG